MRLAPKHPCGTAETLAGLLGRCGQLTPGQVVTVGVQIARELAVLHAAGHGYAGVTAETIALDADGRPSLTPVMSGGGQSVDDLRDLVAVLRTAVGPNAGLSLLRVLGTPTDAAAFARDLYAVCAPEPLFVGPAATRAPRQLRGLSAVGALTGAVVVAGFAGVAWAHAGSRADTAVVPRPTPSAMQRPSVDWAALITRLDAARDAAFTAADPGALLRTYAENSSALATESSAVRALAAHHVQARGLRLVVEVVAVEARTSSHVTLRVVDRLPAYDIVDVHGHVVVHRPARGSHTWQLVLVHTDVGWRIAAVA
jgi:hypothetical protein